MKSPANRNNQTLSGIYEFRERAGRYFLLEAQRFDVQSNALFDLITEHCERRPFSNGFQLSPSSFTPL